MSFRCPALFLLFALFSSSAFADSSRWFMLSKPYEQKLKLKPWVAVTLVTKDLLGDVAKGVVAYEASGGHWAPLVGIGIYSIGMEFPSYWVQSEAAVAWQASIARKNQIRDRIQSADPIEVKVLTGVVPTPFQLLPERQFQSLIFVKSKKDHLPDFENIPWIEIRPESTLQLVLTPQIIDATEPLSAEPWIIPIQQVFEGANLPRPYQRQLSKQYKEWKAGLSWFDRRITGNSLRKKVALNLSVRSVDHELSLGAFAQGRGALKVLGLHSATEFQKIISQAFKDLSLGSALPLIPVSGNSGKNIMAHLQTEIIPHGPRKATFSQRLRSIAKMTCKTILKGF